jgi:transcriptional regulator of arginine metabolism
MRLDRRRDLVEILRNGSASSQAEIADALRRRGHEVTQATVSRDLQELGASKIRVSGVAGYRLPDPSPRSPGGDLMNKHLDRTLAEFAVEVRPADSLVVILTEPGHAAAVARAIDLAQVKEVVGTVAGDDTIFAATRSAKIAASLARRWSRDLTGSTSNGRT